VLAKLKFRYRALSLLRNDVTHGMAVCGNYQVLSSAQIVEKSLAGDGNA